MKKNPIYQIGVGFLAIILTLVPPIAEGQNQQSLQQIQGRMEQVQRELNDLMEIYEQEQLIHRGLNVPYDWNQWQQEYNKRHQELIILRDQAAAIQAQAPVQNQQPQPQMTPQQEYAQLQERGNYLLQVQQQQRLTPPQQHQVKQELVAIQQRMAQLEAGQRQAPVQTRPQAQSQVAPQHLVGRTPGQSQPQNLTSAVASNIDPRINANTASKVAEVTFIDGTGKTNTLSANGYSGTWRGQHPDCPLRLKRDGGVDMLEKHRLAGRNALLLVRDGPFIVLLDFDKRTVSHALEWGPDRSKALADRPNWVGSYRMTSATLGER